MSTKTVGRFTFDEETGQVSGPAEYMRTWGAERIKKIESGQDVVFNFGMRDRPDVDPITLILVSLQTDFAAWLGLQTLGKDGRS